VDENAIAELLGQVEAHNQQLINKQREMQQVSGCGCSCEGGRKGRPSLSCALIGC